MAEDDDNDAVLFRLAVRRYNWSVERVWDGQTAVDYLTGKGDYTNRTRYPLPDIVVLDVTIPRLSGIEVLEWRRTSPFAELPFYVWTGRLDLLSKCLDLGADGAQAKESDFETLVKCLEQVSVSLPTRLCNGAYFPISAQPGESQTPQNGQETI
ncbi:MAG: response regulator [Verrucomicrobiia bacterium]